jgi:hypothetical protein
MRPRERRETGEQDLFRSRLDQIKRLRSIRSGACRTIVCDTKAYEAVSRRSNVNKPQRRRSALAPRHNACCRTKACARGQHHNGQTCRGKRAGRVIVPYIDIVRPIQQVRSSG